MGEGFITRRGGGPGLELKVLGGTSQPTGAANTIWVNTSTAINGYAFSASQPASPVSGMVWFLVGASSTAPMDLDKKNTVMVYPNACYQYVSGAWTAKTAMTYLGGKWVDWWNGQLYTPGNEWSAVTGGWVTKALKASSASSVSATAPTVTKGSSDIYAANTGGGILYCANKIDLSRFSTITFKGSFTRGGSQGINCAAFCWTALGSYYAYENVAASVGLSAASGTELVLDVSGVSGSHYVGLGLTNSSARITEILMT